MIKFRLIGRATVFTGNYFTNKSGIACVRGINSARREATVARVADVIIIEG